MSKTKKDAKPNTTTSAEKELDYDCQDTTFRLSVYEAGHAITAYLLDQKIVSIQMFPRPPMTFTDKHFDSHSWDSFIEILEIRVLELFGGPIAEGIVCQSSSCCTGDISRIDEITRILDALHGEDDIDSEDILFDLEDRAEEMFEPQNVKDTILPLAKFLYQQEMDGHIEIDGKEVTKIIKQHIPKAKPEKNGLLKLLRLA